jgi:hypothetical protein
LARAIARLFRRGQLYGLIQTQQSRSGLWWFWPVVVVLLGVGAVGLVRCIYLGWSAGAVFTLVWLAGLAWISTPDRKAWRDRALDRPATKSQ